MQYLSASFADSFNIEKIGIDFAETGMLVEAPAVHSLNLNSSVKLLVAGVSIEAALAQHWTYY